MRSAPFLEQKLQLRSYLLTQNGDVVKSRMQSVMDVSRPELDLIFDQLPDLELYMPVVGHRNTWMGEGALIVASSLREDDPPVGYTLDGLQVLLDPRVPPTTPVLAVVPSETDFSKPQLRRNSTTSNANDGFDGQLREVTPRFEMCSTPETCGGSGGGNPQYPGIYITRNVLEDLHEPWIKGEPEIEIHTLVSSNASNKEQIRCVRESGFGSLHFEQNDFVWNGSVLLIEQADLDALPTGDGVEFFIWEDDNTGCVVTTDGPTLQNYFWATLSAVGGIVGFGDEDYIVGVAGIVGSILNLTPAEDDLVGQIVYSSGACVADGQAHNAKVMLGNQLEGCTQLLKE